MSKFLVTVACLAHFKACPIPDGYSDTYRVINKQACEAMAKVIIAGFGYHHTDFRIKCIEK